MSTADNATHEQHKQDIVAMFDRAAHLYDQVGVRQFTYFGNLLIERLNIPVGAQVLDIASGRGALLLPAAEKVGITGHIIGIDLAPEMVAHAQGAIKHRGFTQAEALLMDAEQLAFPENNFDYITCGSALHFLQYERVLPNLLRMLKHGGTFAATIPYMSLDDQEDLERWRWLPELARAVFPPDFVPPAAWLAHNRLNKPERAQAALHEAGFVEITTQYVDTTLYFVDEDDWWAWEWSQGSRFWLEGMSPDGLERFKRESFGQLREMKRPDGIPMSVGALFVTGKKAPC
jgi:O-methyltransferase/aklanonic acid methyltransferase